MPKPKYDSEGKLYVWTDPRFIVYYQVSKTVAEISALAKGADEEKMMDLYNKVLDGNSENVYFSNEKFHGLSKDGSRIYGENTAVNVQDYLTNEKAFNAAKTFLKFCSDLYRKEAKALPKDKKYDKLRTYYENRAFFTDPGKGSLLEAHATKPYMTQISSMLSGAPRFDTLGIDGVIDGMNGAKNSKGEPQPAFDAFMELLESDTDELRVEYHRQQMAETGWDAKKEKQYLAELKAAHEKTLKSFDTVWAMEDNRQYDRFLNNDWDEVLGKLPGGDNNRVITGAIGMIRGELRAIEKGWPSDELGILGFVGAVEAEIRRKKLQLADDPKAMADLAKLEEEFNRDLKSKTWDADSSDPAAVEEAAEAVYAFADAHKNNPYITTTTLSSNYDIWIRNYANAYKRSMKMKLQKEVQEGQKNEEKNDSKQKNEVNKNTEIKAPQDTQDQPQPQPDIYRAGTKNPGADSAFQGHMTLDQFKRWNAGFGLTDQGYQWLYEHLTDQEAMNLEVYGRTGRGENPFASWENPLARGTGTMIPREIRLLGNGEELKEYLMQNADTLPAADKLYVLRRIETLEKTAKIKEEAAAPLDGVKRSAPLEIYKDNDGYTRLATQQPRPQETSQGCWSVAMQQLVSSRGVQNVTQEDIRAYRPAENDLGALRREAAKRDGQINQESADNCYNLDQGNVVHELLDAQLAMAPNSMARLVDIAGYPSEDEEIKRRGITREQYNKAASELIRQSVEKAIYIDKSPLIIKEPGHYLNIIGIQGDMLLINDPRRGSGTNGDRIRRESVSSFVERMGLEGVQLIWSSDIRLDKTGNVIGLPDPSVKIDANGTVQLNEEQKKGQERLPVEQTAKEGHLVSLWSGKTVFPDDADKNAEHTTIEGLIRTDQVYLPKKIDLDGLQKEAARRSNEDEEKLKKDAELYFKNVSDLQDLNIRTVLEQGEEAARRELADKQQIAREQAAARQNVQTTATQTGNTQLSKEDEEKARKEREEQEKREEEKRREEQVKKEEEARREELAGAYRVSYGVVNLANELQAFQAQVRPGLERLRLFALNRPEDSEIYKGLVTSMQQVLDLGPDSTLYDLIQYGTKLSSYHDACKKLFLQEAAGGKAETAERRQRMAVLEDMEGFLKESTSKISANTHSIDNIDPTRPMSETLRNAQEKIGALEQPDRVLQDSRIAADFAAETESFAAEAKRHLDRFKKLTKTFGSDSEQYTNMINALRSAAALDRNSTAYEVARTVQELKGFATAYKEKIEAQDGGHHGNGEKRINETKALLAGMEGRQLPDRIPVNINAMKPLRELSKPAMDAYLEANGFEKIDFDMIPFTVRYTKDRFMDMAEEQGWICVMEGANDRVWMEQLYDAAAKSQDPRFDAIMDRLISENVWDKGDHLAEHARLMHTLEPLENEGLLPKISSTIDDFQDQELEDHLEVVQARRRKAKKPPLVPKERTDDLQPEPVSPYYEQLTDEKGRKKGWTWEIYAERPHCLDTQQYSGTLYEMGYASEEMLRYFNKAKAGVVRTGAEWQGTQPGNIFVEVKNVFASEKDVAYAKKAMRMAKEGWLKAAEDERKKPDGEPIARYMEGFALFADPDAGNYMEAVSRSMYLNGLVNAAVGGIKLMPGKSGVGRDEAVAGLKGLAPEMASLPPELRKDIYEDFMGFFPKLAQELKVEYHRQQMALGGWDAEKEEIYTRELMQSHRELIDGYKKILAIKNIGQYDRYLENTLDHSTGKRADSRRDIHRIVGIMEGEMQALSHGWSSDETVVLATIGGIGAVLEKQRNELLHSLSANGGQYEKLLEFEEAYRKLKDDLWDKNMTTQEEKAAAADQLMDFVNTWNTGMFKRLVESYTENKQVVDDRIAKMKFGLPEPAPEKVQEREKATAEARKKVEALDKAPMSEKSAERKAAEAVVMKEAKDKALENGWTDHHADYVANLAQLKNSLEMQLEQSAERNRRFGTESPGDARKKELIGVLSEVIGQTAGKKVNNEAGMDSAISEAEHRLQPFLGDVELLWTQHDMTKAKFDPKPVERPQLSVQKVDELSFSAGGQTEPVQNGTAQNAPVQNAPVQKEPAQKGSVQNEQKSGQHKMNLNELMGKENMLKDTKKKTERSFKIEHTDSLDFQKNSPKKK